MALQELLMPVFAMGKPNMQDICRTVQTTWPARRKSSVRGGLWHESLGPWTCQVCIIGVHGYCRVWITASGEMDHGDIRCKAFGPRPDARDPRCLLRWLCAAMRVNIALPPRSANQSTCITSVPFTSTGWSTSRARGEEWRHMRAGLVWQHLLTALDQGRR